MATSKQFKDVDFSKLAKWATKKPNDKWATKWTVLTGKQWASKVTKYDNPSKSKAVWSKWAKWKMPMKACKWR